MIIIDPYHNQLVTAVWNSYRFIQLSKWIGCCNYNQNGTYPLKFVVECGCWVSHGEKTWQK